MVSKGPKPSVCFSISMPSNGISMESGNFFILFFFLLTDVTYTSWSMRTGIACRYCLVIMNSTELVYTGGSRRFTGIILVGILFNIT